MPIGGGSANQLRILPILGVREGQLGSCVVDHDRSRHACRNRSGAVVGGADPHRVGPVDEGRRTGVDLRLHGVLGRAGPQPRRPWRPRDQRAWERLRRRDRGAVDAEVEAPDPGAGVRGDGAQPTVRTLPAACERATADDELRGRPVLERQIDGADPVAGLIAGLTAVPLDAGQAGAEALPAAVVEVAPVVLEGRPPSRCRSRSCPASLPAASKNESRA